MKYALIGEKLSHTLSPQIHQLLGNDDYVVCELTKQELDDFFERRDFQGINVTIPYKKDVIKYCSSISSEAAAIGSVNTIINQNGNLFGYNTDCFGFEYMLKNADISLLEKDVVILGSGGTAKTAEYVAKLHGAKSITVVSRSGAINYQNMPTYCNVLINTTPVGMFPNDNCSPIDLRTLEGLESVVDVIYNPQRTLLLQQAKRLKLKYTNGLNMLVAQAKMGAELFFNTKISNHKITQVETKIKNIFQNIVLVGMPSCGKSTLAKLLSKKLGLPYFDSDREIEKMTNTSVVDIFAKEGEPYFRTVEEQAVEALSRQNGIIISTGGGAVLSEKNRRNLAKNGIVFYINRNLEKLSVKGRPLSKDIFTLRKMYNLRHPLYEDMCDAIVDNNGKTSKSIKEILTFLG